MHSYESTDPFSLNEKVEILRWDMSKPETDSQIAVCDRDGNPDSCTHGSEASSCDKLFLWSRFPPKARTNGTLAHAYCGLSGWNSFLRVFPVWCSRRWNLTRLEARIRSLSHPSLPVSGARTFLTYSYDVQSSTWWGWVCNKCSFMSHFGKNDVGIAFCIELGVQIITISVMRPSHRGIGGIKSADLNNYQSASRLLRTRDIIRTSS